MLLVRVENMGVRQTRETLEAILCYGKGLPSFFQDSLPPTDHLIPVRESQPCRLSQADDIKPKKPANSSRIGGLLCWYGIIGQASAGFCCWCSVCR